MDTDNASGPASLDESRPQTGRSIVVDTAVFEEQFLRCQICNERFNKSERSPKSLPCNHTYCLPCLTQIFDHAQPQSRRHLLWADGAAEGTLKCPTCRVEIVVSKNKIKDLPNDHRVVQMMDFLSQAVSATTQNLCSRHERQPLNFFCRKCLMPVCRDCTVLDHKEQQGHIIVDVKQAVSDSSSDFNQMENSSRQILEKMKTRSDSLANASKRLDIQERQLRAEIKETFIEYRLLLEKRQEAMTQTLQQKIREQKALINTRFVNVCEHGTQLQKLFDAFTKAKNSNDVQQLFILHKQMKDQEEQFKTIATAEDNELFKSCSFEPTFDCEFLSQISSLGNVSVKDDLNLKQPVSAQQLEFLESEEQREREHERQLQRDHELYDLQSVIPSRLSIGNEDLEQELDDYETGMDRLLARYRRTEDPDHDDFLNPQHLIYSRPGRLVRQAQRIPSFPQLYVPELSQHDVATTALPIEQFIRTSSGSRQRSSSRPSRGTSREQQLNHQHPGNYRVVRHAQNVSQQPDEVQE
ncbi:E3 ubiquitin-protein ligase TRIM63-like isoform X3 [Pomacea canaliculata]|nr:E3 ubiquitin-protein ligase TRIM63-like isoform X3 [Pomacea canaliculata]XP_025085400.1 E3 ubiquitin-protein ligase TRIM63-like isoform X3 [Pomacea canaliculata]